MSSLYVVSLIPQLLYLIHIVLLHVFLFLNIFFGSSSFYLLLISLRSFFVLLSVLSDFIRFFRIFSSYSVSIWSYHLSCPLFYFIIFLVMYYGNNGHLVALSSFCIPYLVHTYTVSVGSIVQSYFLEINYLFRSLYTLIILSPYRT